MAKSISPRKKAWKTLLRSSQHGPAAEAEAAMKYIDAYPDDFGGWVLFADAMWSFAKYDTARRALRRADRLIPKRLRHRLFVQWGIFYNEKNDLKRAEVWFRRAVKARPTTGHLIFLGGVLAKQGKLAEAEKVHRRAIRTRTPGDAVDEAHHNLGLVLRARRRQNEAAKHFVAALRIDPRYRQAKEALRDVRAALRIRRQVKAPHAQ